MDERTLPHLRVAIIHYWLTGMRGREKVVEALCRIFPQADIYTHVVRPEALSETITSHPIHTTFIQKLPGSVRHYQKYLPLMPLALEQLDLRGSDLVISSESGPAKGVITRADTPHICYCHSPMRYLWDFYQDYLESAGAVTRLLMRPLFHRLRLWDYASAQRVDHVIANSRTVARRVKRWWGKEAAVIHPPVDISRFSSPTAPPRNSEEICCDAREVMIVLLGMLYVCKFRFVGVYYVSYFALYHKKHKGHILFIVFF